MPEQIELSNFEQVANVSALLQRPSDARWLLVLAHGAGAGMRHPFMEMISEEFAKVGIATFRYQFPFAEQGKRRPDPPLVLTAAVRSAVAAALDVAPDLPLLAGGKSLGGRMTSLATSQAALPKVRGLVFLGFPLHAPGRHETQRAHHLAKVKLPMLFVQGTRDKLADLDLLCPICDGLPSASLHVVETADHSFRTLKRSGKREKEVLVELAQTVSLWASTLA